jgi:hypothetical protein
MVNVEDDREIHDLKQDEGKEKGELRRQFSAPHQGGQAHEYWHRRNPQNVVENAEESHRRESEHSALARARARFLWPPATLSLPAGRYRRRAMWIGIGVAHRRRAAASSEDNKVIFEVLGYCRG